MSMKDINRFVTHFTSEAFQFGGPRLWKPSTLVFFPKRKHCVLIYVINCDCVEYTYKQLLFLSFSYSCWSSICSNPTVIGQSQQLNESLLYRYKLNYILRIRMLYLCSIACIFISQITFGNKVRVFSKLSVWACNSALSRCSLYLCI